MDAFMAQYMASAQLPTVSVTERSTLSNTAETWTVFMKTFQRNQLVADSSLFEERVGKYSSFLVRVPTCPIRVSEYILLYLLVTSVWLRITPYLCIGVGIAQLV
jgi:hypothetical protein